MNKTSKLGALWRSDSDNSRAPFAKGSLEINGMKIAIVLWPNRYKAEDLQSADAEVRARAHRSPDYYIERDERPPATPEDERIQAQRARPQNLPLGRRTQTETRASADGFDDDVPF